MPRKPRTVLPGLPHHVYNRGNNKRRLFSRSSDYLAFLRCLMAAVALARCRIWQLTLMSNHFHMVVVPPRADSLAVMMKRCTQRYAQLRNGERASTGTLFEGRFKSKVIDSDDYLLTLMLYNDTNAYRAGLVTEPSDHRWSTIGFHSGDAHRTGVPTELWTPSQWFLALGASDQERAATYRRLVVDYIGRGAPAPDDVLEEWERRARETYRLRVERPDRRSAR